MRTKKFFTKITAVGAIAATTVTFAACGNSNVAGTWYDKKGYIYHLDSNGTWYDNSGYSGTYKVKGDQLTMTDINGNESVIIVKGDTWEYEGEVVAEKG